MTKRNPVTPLIRLVGDIQIVPNGRTGWVVVTTDDGQTYRVVTDSPRRFAVLCTDLGSERRAAVKAAVDPDGMHLIARYHSYEEIGRDESNYARIEGVYLGRWTGAPRCAGFIPIKVEVDRRGGDSRSRPYGGDFLLYLAKDLEPRLPEPGARIECLGEPLQSGMRTRRSDTGRPEQMEAFRIRIHTLITPEGDFMSVQFPPEIPE